ncbi:hypothetical protein ACQBAR_03770 [Propionibacteriaceae bacterium Y1685]
MANPKPRTAETPKRGKPGKKRRKVLRRIDERYDSIPVSWHHTLTYGPMLTAVGAMLVLAVLLVVFAHRIGFAPQTEVYRSGTVHVTSCSPTPGSMQSCQAQVIQWNDDVQPGLEVTDSPTVWVLSRTPLSGKVAVVSRIKMVTVESPHNAGWYDVESEVIMPADQQVLPNSTKVLIVVGILFGPPFAAMFLSRPLWEIARVVSLRRTAS